MDLETSRTLASGLDVTAHEITHGVLEKIVLNGHSREEKNTIFPYADETGAINEGYADVFGYFVDNSNWTMGEEWKTFRSLSDPGAYDAPVTLDDPNYYKVTADVGTDEYKKQESLLVHTNSSLVYHAAYLMHTYGITGSKLENLWYNSMSKGYDATSDFYTVRRFLIQAAKANGMSDTEVANVRKAFDTERIFDERGSIKITLQDADGNLLDTVSGGGIQYSFVRDKKDVPENEYQYDQADGSGIEKSDIYFGTYKMNITAPGYVPFEGSIEVEKNKTSEITVTLVKAGNGQAGGVITSATTGQPVSDVSLKVREGWNTKTGAITAESFTDENGTYVFGLAAGNYTIEMSKDGYSTGYLNIAVDGNKVMTDQNASISPIIELGDNFRVVLSWGENPSDLDAHLVGQADGQYSYHVYYRNKNGYDNSGNRVANLDVDDRTSYGPETTTFTASADGSYEYYIDWYLGSGTWATSGAKVEVYSGNSNEAVYVFDVPNWDSSGGKWPVFTYKNGILKKSY